MSFGWAKSLFGRNDPPKHVVASFGKTQFHIEIEPEDSEDPRIGPSLGFLRNKIAELLTPLVSDQTAVSRESGGAKARMVNPKYVTLIYSGKKLIGDEQSLVSLGVKTNGKILILYTPESTRVNVSKAQPPAAKKKGRKTTKLVVAETPHKKVERILQTVSAELANPIENFRTQPPSDKEEKQAEHRRLSELLLQHMFELDDIDVTGDSELRQLRKNAINQLHQYNEQIDLIMKRPDSTS